MTHPERLMGTQSRVYIFHPKATCHVIANIVNKEFSVVVMQGAFVVFLIIYVERYFWNKTNHSVEPPH